MSEQVAGLKGLEAAKEKWTDHFNDTRKKAKNDILVRFRHGFHAESNIFHYVINVLLTGNLQEARKQG